MIICKVDNSEHSTEEELLKHLRFKLKVRQADYYEKYFPRFDKFSKQQIPFKARDTYSETDFLTRRNMAAWFKTLPIEEAKKFCLDLLKKSKEKREEENVSWAPSQSELKTVMSPSIPTFEKIFGKSFNEICKDLNWECLYDYSIKTLPINPKQITIAVDTREQNELLLATNTIKMKLNYGDYAATGEDYSKVLIDRKSLVDLAGTLSQGVERFDRELKRAAEMDDYIIVLCEESFSNFQSIKYLPHCKKVKASYEFLAHRMRETARKNKNCQFIFSDGRKESSRLALKILKDLGAKARQIDLQYYLDQKIL